MRVTIPTPSDWPVEESERGRLITPAGHPGWRLFTSRLQPVPPLFTWDWARRKLEADLPRGARLVIRHADETTSDDGWPMTVWTCAVEGAALAETRLMAGYRFIYFFGTAELWAETPVAAAPSPLIELLRRASPDFSGEIACLAHIYAT
jgi:hypothetical protein